MPRLKGSKNKKKDVVDRKLVSLIEQIADKQSRIEALVSETDNLAESIAELHKELRSKKSKLRKLEKEYTELQVAKEQEDALAEVAARKAEAEKIVETAIASGKSAEEIMQLLST